MKKSESVELFIYYAFSLISAISLRNTMVDGGWFLAGVSILSLFLFTRAMFKTHAILAQEAFIETVKDTYEADAKKDLAHFRAGRKEE